MYVCVCVCECDRTGGQPKEGEVIEKCSWRVDDVCVCIFMIGSVNW